MRRILLFVLIAIISTTYSCKKTPSSNVIDDVDLNGYNDETFFKTQGTEILNRQGEPVVIRGFGLGGWLLPEGYMYNMPGHFGATLLREEITDLLGASEAERWFNAFRDNYVTEDDIIAMKEWGADHIRVPFHYDIFYDLSTGEFKEDGFDRIDELLIWCKRQRMDVILDMHAAPGAQNDSEISDSDGTARLWTEYDTYMPITIKIWKEIARRYKDETIIIGYDVLNEPVTPDGYGAEDLLQFYKDLIPEIRDEDENHIIFVEGNYYATTFDLLDIIPSAYDNIVFAFHKYWNETDQGTINYLLALRDQSDTPLWLGESGENSNTWFYETTRLVENNNIGWNWWTHKKLETITSPLSSPTNENYNKVINYWKGNGAKPTMDEATSGLFQMAEDLAIDKTTLRPGVVAALFANDFAATNTPFSELSIPGTIPASHYDIGNNGVSYNDTDYKRVNGSDTQTGGNSGWSFRNDGVDLEASEDPEVAYNVGWTNTGEWLEYTVDVTEAGTYEVDAWVSSPGDGVIRVKVNGKPVGADIDVPNSGGYQNWQRVTIGEEDFTVGTVIVRVEIVRGGFNFSKLVID